MLISVNLGRELVDLLLDVSVRVTLEEVDGDGYDGVVSGQLLGALGQDDKDLGGSVLDQTLEQVGQVSESLRDLE